MHLKWFFISLITLLSIGLPTTAKTLNWNIGRGYEPFQFATKDGILIDNPTDTIRYNFFSLPNSSTSFTLNFRAKNIHGNLLKKHYYITREGRKINVINPHWGFFITCEKDTLVFSVKGNEIQYATESLPSLDISYYNLPKNTKEKISLTEKINPYDGDNLWMVSISEDNLNLLVGDKSLNSIFESKQKSPITGFGFFAGWGDKILISDIKIEYKEDSDGFDSKRTAEEIEEYLNQSEDPMEGYWTLFDRELEESLLKLGGHYTLLCIKDGEGYSFFYIDGALVNSQRWTPGDLKATLTPTPFSDIFEVKWVDSMKDPINNDIKAQKGEGETLLIQFPYQSSKIRLRKIPSNI